MRKALKKAQVDRVLVGFLSNMVYYLVIAFVVVAVLSLFGIQTTSLIAVLGAAYLISPIDLMPALLMGPIGLLDDLVVVGAVLSRMLNRVHPDVVRSHWSGRGDALEAIQRVTAWTERVFGDRVRQVTDWVTGAVR